MVEPSIRNGLLAHFCIWWLGSALMWIMVFHASLLALFVLPLTPVLVGPSYFRLPGLGGIGAVSVLSAIGLALSSLYSLRNGRKWTVLLAHLSILIYWVVDFLLTAAQV